MHKKSIVDGRRDLALANSYCIYTATVTVTETEAVTATVTEIVTELHLLDGRGQRSGNCGN